MEIDQRENLYRMQLKEVDSFRNNFSEKINALNERENVIENELNKSRGRISAIDFYDYSEKVIADGKYTISTEKLARNIASALPGIDKYVCTKEAKSSMNQFGTQWKICFIDQEEENNDGIGINIYCTAPKVDSPIENIVIESIPMLNADNRNNLFWCTLVSNVILFLSEGMSSDMAEDFAINIRYNKKTEKWKANNSEIYFEYASASANLRDNKDIVIIRIQDCYTK